MTETKTPTASRKNSRKIWAMRSNCFRMVAAGVILCALAGCGSDNDRIVGLWHGTCSDSPTQTYSRGSFSIEFREDGTFTGRGGTYNSTEEGHITLVDNEQIIFTAANGGINTAGYTLDDHYLRLLGLIDPNKTNPTPAWCTLTRTSS